MSWQSTMIPGMMLPANKNGNYQIDPNTPRMDYRFFQGASEGLCEHALSGGEYVKLMYMDPEYPSFEFGLPGEKPAISITRGRKTDELTPALQTVLIDKEDGLLSMVWRGGVEYDGLEEFEKGVIAHNVT
jgi:hypothetical protein